MRSIIASVVLATLAGCASVQRPASVHGASVSAAACDSAVSIASERAHLASVARTLGEISSGADRAAYTTVEARIAAPSPSTGAPNASAAKVTSSMIANASNARVDLWSAEARQERSEYQVVVAQVAALDAAARALPTIKSCRAAGLASFTPPTG